MLRFRDGMRRHPFLQRRLPGISKMANSRQTKPSDEHRLCERWRPSNPLAAFTDHGPLTTTNFSKKPSPARSALPAPSAVGLPNWPIRQPAGYRSYFHAENEQINTSAPLGLDPAALNLPAARFALSARVLLGPWKDRHIGPADVPHHGAAGVAAGRTRRAKTPRFVEGAQLAPEDAQLGGRPWPLSRPNPRRCRGKPKTPCPRQDSQLPPPKTPRFCEGAQLAPEDARLGSKAVAGLQAEPPPLPRNTKTPCPCQDAQLHPQKRRVFAKVRNSRAKARNSAAGPGRSPDRTSAGAAERQKPRAPAKTRNCHPPKNAAFLRRCATRARRCATRHVPLTTDHGPRTTGH